MTHCAVRSKDNDYTTGKPQWAKIRKILLKKNASKPGKMKMCTDKVGLLNKSHDLWGYYFVIKICTTAQ